jgi:hypothetical protein
MLLQKRRRTGVLRAAIVTVLVSAGLTAAATTGTAGGVQRVNKPWTELKSGHPSFVIGNLPHDSHVYVYGKQQAGYRWTYTPQLDFCLWMFDQDVDPTPQKAPAHCRQPHEYSVSTFTNGQIGKTGRGPYGTDGAPTRLAPEKCGGKVGQYANVAPWRSTTLSGAQLEQWKIGTVTTKLDVKWRYVTKDGRFVMVRDPALPNNATPNWYFVRRACITI